MRMGRAPCLPRREALNEPGLGFSVHPRNGKPGQSFAPPALRPSRNEGRCGRHAEGGRSRGEGAVTEADREKWDQRYAEGSYRPRSYPSPFLVERLAELPRGRALDLACGAGRNALCLAEAGYEVEAVDISPVAIERARAAAHERGLEVDWRVADLDGFKTAPGRYDLITVIRYTNREMMAHLPDGLAEGGRLLVEHHLHTSEPVGGPTSRAFRLAPNELVDLFHGRLRVLFYDERIAPDPDGQRVALVRFLGCRGSPGF